MAAETGTRPARRPVAERLRYLLIAVCAVAALLTGCARTQHFSATDTLRPPASTADIPPRNLTIALMPMDIELAVLTAGGVTEPNAAWTHAAEGYLADALRRVEATRGKAIVRYERPPPGDPVAPVLNEIEHLHGAVGHAIMRHKLVVPLPSKKDRFDWSLGPDVAVLRDRSHADYALFIFIRDSYSSAGRVFTQLAAAALGIGLAGGQQVGFASLVDLVSGDIIWFNFLASATGDLRNPRDAEATLNNLLAGMPR